MNTNDHYSLLRKKLEEFDDTELESFILDNFPDIHRRIGRGMLTDEKINLLLSQCRRRANDEAKLKTLLAMSEEIKGETLNSKSYLRLFLRCTNDGNIEVTGLDVPGGGTPVGKTPLPFSGDELAAISKALDTGEYNPTRFKPEYTLALENLGLLRNGSLVPQFLKIVGSALYHALFPPQIHTELINALREKLPVVCELVFKPEDVNLAQFPWELIHDGDFHLTLISNGIELIRSVALADPPNQLHIPKPLHMLIISPRPENDLRLPSDLETDAIQNSLADRQNSGDLIMNKLSPPTWDALSENLIPQLYSLIHFDGHGAYSRVCKNCKTPHYPGIKECSECHMNMEQEIPIGRLHFEDHFRQRDMVDADELKTLLARNSIRVVILSACSSAVVKGDSMFNGIAPALMQAGIPCVVAMQGSPNARSAALFIESFYNAFADGKRIPEAVNVGRRAIARENPACWFMPVVYLRSVDRDFGQLC